ncbi:MAG: ATP-binding cassette domain-containing protein, partial [Rhodospirillaceae bacterium]
DVLKNPAQARALMAVVFQAPAVDKHLSVGENLALHGRLYGLSGAAYREREEEALAWTMLKDRLKDKVGTLSGGLSRQVELAKCLLTRPQLLLLDEPTTGLDPAGRRAFLDTLLSLQRERAMTVLMTTHIFSEAEQADEVLILKEGRLIAQDRPSVLRSSLGRDVVVATAPTPEAARQLAPAFDAALGVTCRLHGEELRIEELPEDGPVALIDRILSQYRDQLSAVAVKQPTLEDVFIHLTASTPDPELAEAASS